MRPGPLKALNAARVYDCHGQPQTIDTQAFVPDHGASTLAFMPWIMPVPGRIAAGIELDVTVGFGNAVADVPEPLRQAIRLLVGIGREPRPGGRWRQKHGAAVDRRRIDLVLPGAVAVTGAGDLNRRLLLEAPVETDDGAGGVTLLYDVVTVLWAQVLPLTATASVTAGNAGATVRYRIIVRARSDITTRHRFQDGTRIYRIVATRPTADRRFLEIEAEEREDSHIADSPPEGEGKSAR